MASSETHAVMNVRLAIPVKGLVETFAQQRGITQAAATAWLLLSGAKAEGLDTSAIDGSPTSRTA